ncbi:alpha/beta fold hydrolase [Pukyongiella litopenaei]|uniref:Alpha/beta hydrolase n=1 Tax=Pukyongiella litopenaei TaxID=2605946 RepID=A0A5C2H2H0_9RHOB|nr:alpha/beta hydrolase [Pukyongiella litopenaei]QEP30644.1 alpha/beta hydrolase [Pukyongiella litopenaei]
MTETLKETTPIRRETVSLAGREVDLCRAGQGGELLFLHSGPSPVYDSRSFLERLARDHTVFAPGHPGLGRLPRPAEFRRIDDLVYFYLDLVDELGLRGRPVVAASVGGWIAAEMALRDPGLFSAMVLINPLGLRVGAPMDRPIADIWAMPRTDRRALQFARAEFQSDDPAGRSDEELLELARFEENLSRYAWKPFLHNPVLARWLGRIRTRTLVIRGAEDRFVAEAVHRALAEGLPNAHLALVSGAGHQPHVEDPVAVALVIDDFLNDCRSTEGSAPR